MKKTRLISLLLTAALALSSMPIMVSADEAAAERVDVLADAVIAEADVTDVTDLTIGGGNKYLHVYRGADTTGFIYTPASMEAGKTYYVEFDARNAVENVYSTGVVNHFRMRAGNQRWATKAAVNSDPVNQPDLVVDGAIVGDTSLFGGAGDWVHKAILKDGWIHYTLALTAAAGDSNLQFYGGSMPGGSCDIQIDNFRFYEEGTNGVTINFENGEAPGFAGRSCEIAVVEAADYTKAASGTVTFVVNQDIAGGACPFNGEVRYGVYHADNTNFASSKANIAVIAVIDGVDYEIASADEVKNWTALSAVAELPAGNLSEIKLVSEDAAALNSAIHFKNFSFKAPVEVSPITDYVAGAPVSEADVQYDIADAVAENGNSYLHIGDRAVLGGGNTAGFYFNPGITDTGVYYMEFDARNSIDGETVPSGKHYREMTASTLLNAVSVTDLVTGEDVTATHGTIGNQSHFYDAGWKHYVLKWTGAANSIRCQGRYIAEVVDYDIDNFKFFKEVDGQKVQLFSYNFEDGAVPATFSGSSATLEVLSAENYNRAPSGVTFNMNKIIPEGVYMLYGDVRYAYSYNAANTPAGVTAKVVAVVDGQDVVLNTVNDLQGNNWASIQTPVELPVGGNITALKIVIDAGEGNRADLDYKNVSLMVIVPTADEEEEDKGQMPNLGIVMVLLAKKRAAAEGGAATSAFTVDGKTLGTKTVKAVEGNKYLEVSERTINTTGVKLVSTLPAGDYTLDFDLRSSVELEIVADAGIDYSTNDAGDIFRIRTSSDTTVFTDFAKDGWKTFSYAFAADGENAVGIEIYGGFNQMQSMPFDIDNIVIKDADGAVVYTENFDALDAQDFGVSLALTGAATNGSEISIVPRGEASFAIIAEDAYVSAKVADKAVVSYNAEALAAGNYVAKGYIRNSYFNANGSAKDNADAAINSADYLSWFAADTTFTYNGEEIAATAGLIALNKNQFALKVSVGAETASYKVTSRWTAFEVPFTVAEGDAAPVVNFEIDHDMPYTINKKAVVPFDLKVEIVPAQ